MDDATMSERVRNRVSMPHPHSHLIDVEAPAAKLVVELIRDAPGVLLAHLQ